MEKECSFGLLYIFRYGVLVFGKKKYSNQCMCFRGSSSFMVTSYLTRGLRSPILPHGKYDNNSKMAQTHRTPQKTLDLGMTFDVLSVAMFFSTFVFVNDFQFRLPKVNHAWLWFTAMHLPRHFQRTYLMISALAMRYLSAVSLLSLPQLFSCWAAPDFSLPFYKRINQDWGRLL